MMYWMGAYTFFLLALGFLIGKHTEKQKNDLEKRIAERPITWKPEGPVATARAASEFEEKKYINQIHKELSELQDKIDNPVDKPVYNPSYGDPTTTNWIDNDYVKRQKGEE